jgi:hypothetical protein
MKRRDFITLLGSTAVAWPLVAHAQQPGRLPTIGLLGANTAAAQSEWTAALSQRLRELGWIEGRTVSIEYRWADGRSERFAEFAAEFVRLKVDVILTHNTPYSSRDQGYVRCQVMITVNVCNDCRMQITDDGANKIMDEAFQRGYGKLP